MVLRVVDAEKNRNRAMAEKGNRVSKSLILLLGVYMMIDDDFSREESQNGTDFGSASLKSQVTKTT